jgi:protein-S-isoprenylcysteine O-methyltransferase Ste14
MKLPSRFDPLYLPWLVFAAYWLLSMRNLKPVKSREPAANRGLQIVVIVIAALLVFSDMAAHTVLRRRFVAHSATVYDLGLAMACAGIAVAIWARYHIGAYWSGRVTLKQDHKLIQSGPYARVRHPIYSGLLLAWAGTVLAIGRWSALVALVAVITVVVTKAMREQRVLEQEFGEQYRDYKRRAGFLFPRFRMKKQNGRADPLPLEK